MKEGCKAQPRGRRFEFSRSGHTKDYRAHTDGQYRFFSPRRNLSSAMPNREQEIAMTYKAELTRHFPSREQAYAYLASRGFLYLPNGWENGRWAASIDILNRTVTVSIWLREKEAA
jgi:hypothetical protein